ncbi:hypothetical protein MLD38_015434 [Melastoma candidum]|uniref:Uncharacterized protein n=1 Tax=Melastoma candidum TaxID=119954 RepID=A0ACB9RJ76_9MYRT|nr:hypothetical protein MLD38_015434 [Melastoma candidum]
MATPTPTCWTNVLKSSPNPSPCPTPSLSPAVPLSIFGSAGCSTGGVSVAVIDANAIIDGGDRLRTLADRFVSVPEVIAEVRDPVSRRRLEFLPFDVETFEPSPEALSKVIKFARATGDLQTLSDVDLKLIALTYTLEAQIHGTKHLKDCPPPVNVVHKKRLPENDMPGWGNNVSNLAEWEALEHEVEDRSNVNTRILPLKDINLNVVANDDGAGDGSLDAKGGGSSEVHESVESNSQKFRRQPLKKNEINIEGKKMVADGIDASQGEFGDDAGDWMPAVSRSTHRRYLRRKARREYYAALSEKGHEQDGDTDGSEDPDATKGVEEDSLHQDYDGPLTDRISEGKGTTHIANGEGDISSILKQMRLEEDSTCAIEEEPNNVAMESMAHNDSEAAGDDIGIVGEELSQSDISSQSGADEGLLDDQSSEQSWMVRSLSESSVACITSDFAMQNVILQIGLRLLAPGGKQIRQLHRWILKCHACYTVTAEIGRIFCPKCGNGGTLRKVAVTVNENGIVMAAQRPRVSLRGTKFSLPLPQGGRDAISKNLILREDQLPSKYLRPIRKKSNKQDDDFFTPDNVFCYHNTDKGSLFQPPVRKALAVFSGKRNPNDNHYYRMRRK